MNLSDLNIKLVDFPETQYYKEETPKTQVVLHHTVSGSKAENVITSWANNPERVATALVISGDGCIVQAFGSKYWAHHLGLQSGSNTLLNKQSIGIEICNWGGLTKSGDKYLNAYGKEVPFSEVIEYPEKFRGFQYFQRYTDAQIESVRKLLIYLWDISQDALNGIWGIYTHVSYRKDKSDCHPQPELIEMLKGLSQ